MGFASVEYLEACEIAGQRVVLMWELRFCHVMVRWGLKAVKLWLTYSRAIVSLTNHFYAVSLSSLSHSVLLFVF